MVRFYGDQKKETKFRGHTVGDLAKAMETLGELLDSVAMTDEETEAVKIATQCILKVAEQLGM